MTTADALHADDYQLMTAEGATLTNLGGIAVWSQTTRIRAS